MSVAEKVARINGLLTAWVVRMSRGETKDVVVDHEIPGVMPQMIDVWWTMMGDTERYRLWHPKDHIWARFEVEGEGEKAVFTHCVLEKIGGIPTLLRMRPVDPSKLSIPVEYEHAVAAASLDAAGRPYAWTLHQYREMQGGTRMRSTFRIPARAPGFFEKALRKHNREEMAQFARFLPGLCKEMSGEVGT